jgi:RNA polymerase sigma-70 factor (ECF subfamily)
MNGGSGALSAADGSSVLPEGDRLAVLKIVVEELRPYLKGVAAAILDERVAGKVDPSDVVQQALLASFAGFDQFRGTTVEDLKAWLVAIVRNEARQAGRFWSQDRREVAREQRLPSGSAGGSGSGLEGDSSDPGERAARREQANHVLAALEKLGAEEAQLVRLRNFEGLTFAEIGQRLDCSETTARERWVAALERLREVIPE